MKGRFSTVDIAAIVKEWKRFIGMRVVNVYDIDNKTYLIRLNRPDEKVILLLESGIRLHSSDYDWPKNPAPSGFSMKLRKHLKNRRLESVTQLGMDRIVDFQFGSDEAAYHVILELYDRGNIVLTDFEFTILNILRPRTDESQDVKLVVHEKYPLILNIKQHVKPTEDRIREILSSGKDMDPIKKLLLPHLDYGPALLEHCILGAGFNENVKLGKGFDIAQDIGKLMNGIEEAELLLKQIFTQPTKGYITQRKDKRPNPKDGESEDLLTYEEFHPALFRQHEKKQVVELPSFDKACDEFFSKVESQRLDMKALQQERTALKKLDHVKKDNEKRIQGLQKEQETDAKKGQLIELNLQLVDQAIMVVRNAIANQIDWSEIWNLIKEAQLSHDPVAMAIKGIKLDTNHMTMLLSDPYYVSDGDDDESDKPLKPLKIDIDLSLSAYANSRKYFEKKKTAKKKEQKTMDASSKAFKSAEKKALKALKEVATAVSINKTRKTYWFEKFLWFISSENFLVIGGRDSQQNELIVKRYFKPGDLYVHADLHGASSVIIKNHTTAHVPPKTLNEAGTMAICNSAAWDAKVITSAWYVYHEQVSKTAPSGEYLTTGSFMIRGKFYIPSTKEGGLDLEEGSVERHRGERKVRTLEDDDAISVVDSVADSETLDIDETETADGEEDSSSSEEDGEKGEEMKEEEAIEEEKEEESSSEEEESSFPDTSINLQHVKGEKFELQRGISVNSTNSTTSAISEVADDTVIYLGDDKPIIYGEKEEIQKGPQQMPFKRGQKAKLRKIKEKYGDQDEEERQLRMGILQSDGPKKEPKRKGKKGRELEQKKQQQAKRAASGGKTVKPVIADIFDLESLGLKDEDDKGETVNTDESRVKLNTEDVGSDDEKDDEATQQIGDLQILETLTGLPLPEDEILYAVPMCAPYNSLTNYK
ncbi:ribosome quality control complex subunit NEMF [Patella vulgata]|uniref:ribosome quality control complex subunit NEMF n=1 Tax=Patella vulgata TaxID=6465 RepID=UPI002180393B|nr:ribosome quality control complex subunit NEMF [Patella vulgata]